MKRFLVACAAAMFAMAASADEVSFSPAQRDAIVKIVRQALKDDPSILRDAVTVLQADDEAHAAAEVRSAIGRYHADLVAHPGDALAGNPSGDVTVVEFYDPRCPYCRKMLPGIDAMLAKDHGVRLVFKDIPVLGPASVMESRAIVAAQAQGAYLKMQAALMHDPAQPSEEMIRQTAKGLGLDSDRLVADMNSAAVTKRIQANMDLARALKVQGTPAFVVGEQMLPGAVDTSALESVVANARKHASR